jgi:hypothetical protein
MESTKMVDVQWHRRLVNSLPDYEGARNGAVYRETGQVPMRFLGIQGYPYDLLLTDIDFPPSWYFQPLERNFLDYATQFEHDFSALNRGPRDPSDPYTRGFECHARRGPIAAPIVSAPQLTDAGL